ncbi:MAG: glycosyltransferase [Armatimonadota bacterium]
MNNSDKNKTDKNKNVMIISFAFPPLGGSGVQRILKFAKYLPSYGWNPVILTVKEAVFHIYTDENCKDLKVYRTGFFDFLNMKRKFTKNKEGSENNINPTKENGKNLLKYFTGFFNQYFLIPDDKIGWLLPAVKEGLKIIKKENIDIIYATGDPFSSFLIGTLLKKLTGKKLVIDYRDSWTDFNLTDPIYFKGTYRKGIENLMESYALKTADKIISVSPVINEKLQKKHPEIPKEKYDIIHNGYDSEDFNGLQKEKNQKFTITHTGIFTASRSPEVFLKALSELVKEDNGIRDNIRVKFIGASLEKDLNQMINKYNLGEYIDIPGYLNHAECVKEIINSDALLLIQDYKYLEAYSGKIFEYLYSKNPILGIVPPTGCAAQLIEETSSGIVPEDDTVKSVKEAIKKVYYNKGFKPGMEIIEQYDRKKLTEKLAGLLGAVNV